MNRPRGGFSVVYHDINTGRQGQPTDYVGPEDFGYPPEEVFDELIADAFAAYLVNPNYLKTVAPKTAARFRQYMNSNSETNEVVQFNSVAAILAGAGAGVPVMFEDNARSDQER